MDESGTFLALMETPSLRRCWLLHKALECAQLERAIEIARAADEFITGAPVELRVADEPVQPDLGASVMPQVRPSVTEQDDERDAVTQSNGAPTPYEDAPTAPSHKDAPRPQGAANQSRLPISPEQRQELMARIANGAPNAELASDYGLSPRQVQGIRMVAARTKPKRAQVSAEAPDRVAFCATASDEVVRYLRQQDDVVVPQGPGEFLVNGRFRMDTTDLVSRANKMRSRQGKPAFQLNGQAPAPPDTVRSSAGHPMFWNDSAAAHPQS